MVEIKLQSKLPKTDLTVIWVDKDNEEEAREELTKYLFHDYDYETGEYAYVQAKRALYCFSNLEGKHDQYAELARIVKKFDVGSIAIKNYDGEPIHIMASDMIGLMLGFYKFDKDDLYKGSKNTFEYIPDTMIYIHTCKARNKFETKQLEFAKRVAEAIYMVRDLVNTPPNYSRPIDMGAICKNILAKNHPMLECEVIEHPPFMTGLNMVGDGSPNKPVLVTLKYRDKASKHPIKIALVGKGVTYDSGGLSIKPTESMTKMKMDKAGACAIMGVMQILSELKPKGIEVTAVLGFAENLIDGESYKPGDIVTTFGGKTVEITNTDAEGRIILADCMEYAQPIGDGGSTYLIDIATLTGACAAGLGPYTIGAFTDSCVLTEIVEHLGDLESVWQLPLDKRLSKELDSDIADMINCPKGKYGGAITAALFLSKFVEKDARWLHLDICGPAYIDKDVGMLNKGATGVGVITLLKIIIGIIANHNPGHAILDYWFYDVPVDD